MVGGGGGGTVCTGYPVAVLHPPIEAASGNPSTIATQQLLRVFGSYGSYGSFGLFETLGYKYYFYINASNPNRLFKIQAQQCHAVTLYRDKCYVLFTCILRLIVMLWCYPLSYGYSRIQRSIDCLHNSRHQLLMRSCTQTEQKFIRSTCPNSYNLLRYFLLLLFPATRRSVALSGKQQSNTSHQRFSAIHIYGWLCCYVGQRICSQYRTIKQAE